MCGIAGVLMRHDTADSVVVKRMTDAMAHRGPDADGHWSQGKIALGHRRLSIIDLSAEANQPFFSEDGRYVIVFNGEIYNYKEVNAALKHKQFRTSSDTETILHAFEEWGISCVEKFKGMFAIAIWDNLENRLLLIRDRFGVKPVYYALTDAAFVFASEIRSILASGLVKPILDEDGLYEYLKFQSVGHPFTLIQGIKQLGAGEFLQFDNQDLTIRSYWDVFERQPGIETADSGSVKKKIRQLMLKSIERRLVADVPVGAFLSGGIDSSAIVGLMAEVSDTPIRTFNVYFDEAEYNEREYAELVAKKFSTEHTGIHLRPEDFLHEVESALAAMDTPSADGINTFVVSKEIRKSGITVALSGLGGDELFGGYPVFKQFSRLRKLAPIWQATSPVRKLFGNYSGQTNKGQRLQEILSLEELGIENIYPVSRALLSDTQIKSFTQLENRITALEQYLLAHAQQMRQFPVYSQVSLAELSGYTQQTLLKDTDQMSMAVSLEIREPFFDDELVRYVLSIPDHIKKPAYPKQLLVESLGDLLPREIVFRKKKGFSFPWKIWMRNQLADFCTQRIKSISQRSFMQDSALEMKWAAFLEGDDSMRWAEFWAFVVLEDWLIRNNIA
ncbi:MAG: asparagine synthase (glutamine-hydrolyzing) [Chitinophagaceae bacterium]